MKKDKGRHLVEVAFQQRPKMGHNVLYDIYNISVRTVFQIVGTTSAKMLEEKYSYLVQGMQWDQSIVQ